MERIDAPISPLHPMELHVRTSADGSGKLRRAEATILLLTTALMGLGLVMVYNASGVLADKYGSPTYFLWRQLAWSVVSVVALWAFRGIDYHLLVRFSRPLMLATLAMLVLVLVPGVGAKLNGARRWFRVAGLGFQPSDIAKLSLIVYLAGRLGEHAGAIKDLKTGFLPPAAISAAAVILVALEPDIGTAVFLGCIAAGMLFVGGARLSHLGGAAMLGVPVGIAYVFSRHDYARARLLAFLDPSADPLGAGYHARQSLIALSSGGLLGRGLGQGSQKLFFLPEAHTDFILAIVGEELGFCGTVGVLVAFGVLVFSALVVASRAVDNTGVLIAFGIGLWLGFQAVLNIAVVTASMPTKGISLPFISYGGSSLVATGAAIGVMLNVAGHALDPPRMGFGSKRGLLAASDLFLEREVAA